MNVADRIAMATLSLTNVSTLASYYSTEFIVQNNCYKFKAESGKIDAGSIGGDPAS